MFPDEISIKILSNFDKKTLNEFSMTSKYNHNLVNNSEFVIFCEKYDFLPGDNKKEIFDELKKERISMEDEVYLDSLDFEVNTMDFIFRNCKILTLDALDIENELHLPRCEQLYIQKCSLYNLSELPHCKILKIIGCEFNNESFNAKILPECEILFIVDMELENLPDIPKCKLLFMKYCEIYYDLPDVKNCEILCVYGNTVDTEYLPNCRLLITEYNTIQTLNTEKNIIVHLINQDDHERIPNSIMNINGNHIVIHNKSDFIDELFDECICRYELNDDFIDNCIKEYSEYINI